MVTRTMTIIMVMLMVIIMIKLVILIVIKYDNGSDENMNYLMSPWVSGSVLAMRC